MGLFCVFGAHRGIICAILMPAERKSDIPFEQTKTQNTHSTEPSSSSCQEMPQTAFICNQHIEIFSGLGNLLLFFVSLFDCLFLAARSVHPGNEGAVQRQPAAGSEHEDLGEQEEEQGGRGECWGISGEGGISSAFLPL